MLYVHAGVHCTQAPTAVRTQIGGDLAIWRSLIRKNETYTVMDKIKAIVPAF